MKYDIKMIFLVEIETHWHDEKLNLRLKNKAHFQQIQMNNLFRKTQQSLGILKEAVKKNLQTIQCLDQEFETLDLNLEYKQDEYLMIIDSDKFNQKNQDLVIIHSQICQLINKLSRISQQKIQLAQLNQNLAAEQSKRIEQNMCQQIERYLGAKNLKKQIKQQHLYSSGLKKVKGRQRNVNPEIKALIQDYYQHLQSQQQELPKAQKIHCICSGTKLLPSEYLIQCSNSDCQTAWYHRSCVGLTLDQTHNDWQCFKCNAKQHDNQNKNPEQINKEAEISTNKAVESLENNQKPQIIKKRGRPRKFSR